MNEWLSAAGIWGERRPDSLADLRQSAGRRRCPTTATDRKGAHIRSVRAILVALALLIAAIGGTVLAFTTGPRRSVPRTSFPTYGPVAITQVAKPGYLQPFADPAFGSTVERIV